MKKLFYYLFIAAAFAFAACSEDDDNAGKEKFNGTIVSFESGEAMTDIGGNPVALKELSIVGGSAAASHRQVLFAKGEPFTSLEDPKKKSYDGYLCSTADQKMWFGSFFIANENNSNYGDFWAGFALTANYGMTATTLDYKNQFTVWAQGGAEKSKNCAIVYLASYMGVYATPTIDFTEAVKIDHLYLANTAITATYTPTVVTEAEYYYKAIVIGSNNGTETGRVECVLINGKQKVNDWVKVDLSKLGVVDCLKFDADSNEKNSYGLLAPTYFALDKIAFHAAQ